MNARLPKEETQLPLQKHKHTIGQEPDKFEEILSKNRRVAGSFLLNKCEKEAARNWDIFYKVHEGVCFVYYQSFGINLC